MASWTDKQMDDAADEYVASQQTQGKFDRDALAEAFKAGVVWGDKQAKAEKE